jgi:hypothetical protein
MKQTLQDQYLLIKEGKGHKGVFLADAKRQFPNIVRNAATFEEASSCLKTKNIISENVIGLNAINSIFEPKKKESYELAFENFLAEAKKKKEDDEKAELKATSKQVEKDLEHNFDRRDDKNPDNLIFDQIMTGYYTEMKDPKNADKTMQELKDMVFKNLQKDPIFYTKEGQFGVKDLGYSVDHPGLGEPKEPKGKYKASGYGDLNEGMENKDPLEREARIALSRIGYSYSVLSNYSRQDFIDTLKKESKNRFSDEEFDNLARRLESLKNESKISPEVYPNNTKINYKGEPVTIIGNFMNRNDESIQYTVEDKDGKTSEISSADKNITKITTESLEESKLRKVIREMIDAELSVLPKTSLKESIEKELAAINKEAEHEIIASKLEKVQTLIDKKQAQISRLDEDEDLKDLTDAKKVKEISKDIKSLEKAKAKLEKMMHKGKAKSPRKEVIDETDEIIDEAEGDLDPKELKDAEKSIKNIQAMADKIAKTELFEDDETLAVEIKEKAEQYYEEYGTLEDALREFENEDEKEFARQHLTDAYGL